MKIYIVNGFPNSGKTTFENMVRKKFPGYIHIISTIDFIKKMLFYSSVWDGKTKDDKTRKLFSDIKDLLTEYNDVPFKKICQKIEAFKIDEKWAEQIIFIDCREPEEIDKLKKKLNAKTILVKRNNKKNHLNHADKNVLKYKYDIVIDNTKDLENLKKEVNKFIIKENIK